MSIYPEIPSATKTENNGQKYFVRKFGLNGKVFEKWLVPISDNCIIRTMNLDGKEDKSKRETIPLDQNGDPQPEPDDNEDEDEQ